MFKKQSYEQAVTIHRFRILFRLADTAWLAKELGVSGKQVKRYLQSADPKKPEVLASMRRLIDEQKHDPNFLGTLEQIRATSEKEQLLNPHFQIANIEGIEIPGWYDEAREAIRKAEFNDALLVLRQRRRHQDDWDRIPDITKPYVLGSTGLASYYTGRWSEAEEAFRAALILTRKIRNDTPVEFLMGYTTNLGLALMRQAQYFEAFECFQEATHYAPYVPAIYYNGICAASILGDVERVGNWSGRMVMIGQNASTEDIEHVLKTWEGDKDLVFARECDTFIDAMNALEAILIKRSANDA
ncbi:hypothetical protein [Roseibium sp. RKSG952]|uniref:hypothetical protein n=1 Tax=Roseibium sp. RKSG952 TaxID=2529384 RepID=UPI0012BD8010|nr:hypothetical protein [Roseibium sp. RKSG952]MTH94847.1 hypothetical protein [Roseibium sp. RKSG952]